MGGGGTHKRLTEKKRNKTRFRTKNSLNSPQENQRLIYKALNYRLWNRLILLYNLIILKMQAGFSLVER